MNHIEIVVLLYFISEIKATQDVAEMFGISGVPMLVIVHPDGMF